MNNREREMQILIGRPLLYKTLRERIHEFLNAYHGVKKHGGVKCDYIYSI